MGFLWFVALAWAFVVCGIGLIGMRTDFVPGAIFFLIGAAPTALMTWFVMARASRREAAHAAMLGEAGIQPGSGCDHSEGGTGIAINKAAKTVTMLVGGVSKTYPFADIREWRSAKHTAGQVVGVGIQGGLAAVGANVAAERQAKAASGFFVSVRDVDHPTWRIEMKNEPTQHRWMELFTQEINEK